MTTIGFVIFGIVSWYITGFDDYFIFLSNYHGEGKTKKYKRQTTIGFFKAVFLMMMLSFIIVNGLSFLQMIAFLGGLVPIYLGWQTWKEDSEGEVENYDYNKDFEEHGFLRKTEIVINNVFFLKNKAEKNAFWGFFLNCLDDITFNAAVIWTQCSGFEQQFAFLGGILIGAFTMVQLVKISNIFGVVDHNKVRGAILVGVGFFYIFLPGLIRTITGYDVVNESVGYIKNLFGQLI